VVLVEFEIEDDLSLLQNSAKNVDRLGAASKKKEKKIAKAQLSHLNFAT